MINSYKKHLNVKILSPKLAKLKKIKANISPKSELRKAKESLESLKDEIEESAQVILKHRKRMPRILAVPEASSEATNDCFDKGLKSAYIDTVRTPHESEMISTY